MWVQSSTQLVYSLNKRWSITARKHALINKYALNRRVRLLTRLYGITFTWVVWRSATKMLNAYAACVIIPVTVLHVHVHIYK